MCMSARKFMERSMRLAAPGMAASLRSVHAGPLVSLTAELVRRSSRDRAVIVTWASSAYLDFLQNWVHHLTSMDVDNILIGAPCFLAMLAFERTFGIPLQPIWLKGAAAELSRSTATDVMTQPQS